MTRLRGTSADSAARFRALQQSRAVKTKPLGRPPRWLTQVPDEWRYVERCVPGAHAAWLAGPNLPSWDFVIGVRGKPAHAIAIGRGLYTPGHAERRRFVLIDGRWIAGAIEVERP